MNLDPLCLFPVKNKKPTVLWSELQPGEKVKDENADGFGMATGLRSGGEFVIDIDDLSAQLPGPIPDTLVRRTPRGGLHIHLRAPEGLRTPTITDWPVPGIDVRGDGGYVVFAAPGYEVLRDAPVAPIPDWQLAKIAEYELKRSQRPPSNVFTVDLDTELGKKQLREAERKVRTLDVGVAGERDLRLFEAALQLRCRYGLPFEICRRLLLEFYCPRVSEDGQLTVSPDRVDYKISQAESAGTWEFIPFTDEDVPKWREASKSLVEEDRRQRLGLMDLSSIPEPSAEYRPLEPKDLVSSDGLDKINFNQLPNILQTHVDWAGRLFYDEFSHEYRVFEPPVKMEDGGVYSNEDISIVRMWFGAALNLEVSHEPLEKAMCLAAKMNRVHPVRLYLASLPVCEDPEAALQAFAASGLGVTDPQVSAYVRKFMIGAARRILEPGVKMDGVLVLKGPQGIGKSSLLYALSPNADWVQEGLSDLESKDAKQDLLGRWLVEIDELQAMLRKSETAVKGFLTKQRDSFRLPYERGNSKHPRQCVFIATTNDDEFLRDSTGARRYLVVETAGIDLEWVKQNRDQIWSAAVALAAQGEEHQLSSDEIRKMAEIQEEYQIEDPWMPSVEEYLKDKEYVKSVQDVYLYALHDKACLQSDTLKLGYLKSFDRKQQLRIASILRLRGWVKRRGKGLGWYRSSGQPD